MPYVDPGKVSLVLAATFFAFYLVAYRPSWTRPAMWAFDSVVLLCVLIITAALSPLAYIRYEPGHHFGAVLRTAISPFCWPCLLTIAALLGIACAFRYRLFHGSGEQS